MARFIGKIETTDYDNVAVDLENLGTVLSGDSGVYTSLLYGGIYKGEFPDSGAVIPRRGKIRDEFLPERVTDINSGTIDSDGYVTPAAVSSYVGSISISGIEELIHEIITETIQPYKDFLNSAIVPTMDVSLSEESQYSVRMPYGEPYVLNSFSAVISPTSNLQSGTLMEYSFVGQNVSGEVEVPNDGIVEKTLDSPLEFLPSTLRKWEDLSLNCTMGFEIEGLLTATVSGSDCVSVMACHRLYYGSYGEAINGSGMLTSQEILALDGRDPFTKTYALLGERGTKINLNTVDGKYIYICVAMDDFEGEGFKINQGDSIDDINVNDWNDEDDIYSGFIVIKSGENPYTVMVNGVEYLIFRSSLQSGGNNLSFTIIPSVPILEEENNG